jgi:hypothetical protein
MLCLLRGVGCVAISGAVAVVTVALLAAGCSSSAEDSGYGGEFGDDGGAEVSTAQDSGNFDGSVAPPPHLVVVHASPELWPFRVCLEDSTTSTGSTNPRSIAPWPDDPSHPAPMSNYPAVALGGGALWSDVAAASKTFVIPYVLDAQQLANSSGDMAKTCDQLVCTMSSCLEKGSGWIALDALDTSTVPTTRAVLLAITGCPKGTGSAAECGSDYDTSTGNLHAHWTALADEGAGDVQIAQLSTNFGAATVTSIFADDTSLAYNLPYLSVAPAASLMFISGSDASIYATDTLTATGDAGSITLSLADITQLTDPSLLPSNLFAASSNLVLGIVGDPSPSVAQIDAGGDASYDGHGLHLIAIPMDPSPDGGM